MQQKEPSQNSQDLKKEQDSFDFMFKIILLGDTGVGKSQILLKYTKNDFKTATSTTIGVEFASKFIDLEKENKKIKVQIWDTTGQEKFRAITKAYYRGAVGALIVYDITSKESFEKVQKWYEELKEYSTNQNYIVVMLVGNKSDLENEERQVSKEEAAKWAEQNKIGFVEVSAKNGSNLQFTFKKLTEQIYQLTQKKSVINSTNSEVQGRETIPLSPKNQNQSYKLQNPNETKEKSQKNKENKTCC